MTTYRLRIEQVIPNENYLTELAAYRERRGPYGYDNCDATSHEPALERTVKVLETTLTDLEFAAVKKACLAVMA